MTGHDDRAIKPSAAGRAWLAAMGLLLVCAGALFTAMLWQSYQRAMETRAWRETPCDITSSLVLSERPTPHSPMAYRAAVHYRYEFEGKAFAGSRVRRVEGPSPHREKADAIVAAYPAGTRRTCFVNPSRPAEAILEHASKAALYALWFPLLFVIGGGMMAWRALRGQSRPPWNRE
jgi:hypothetical protein